MLNEDLKHFKLDWNNGRRKSKQSLRREPKTLEEAIVNANRFIRNGDAKEIIIYAPIRVVRLENPPTLIKKVELKDDGSCVEEVDFQKAILSIFKSSECIDTDDDEEEEVDEDDEDDDEDDDVDETPYILKEKKPSVKSRFAKRRSSKSQISSTNFPDPDTNENAT